MTTYVATTDASGNLKCAAPIEAAIQTSDVPMVKAVDLNYNQTSGTLGVTVTDITGTVAQDSVQLPTATQNISVWTNGTTQSIVLGSDGKLYLANPTGAPSTHNPVNKTNDVDWFGAFNTMNDLLKYALSGSSFLASTPTTNVPIITESATAPAAPKVGDKWRTTADTVHPYAKSVTYEWDGRGWIICLGVPQTVVTSTGTRASAMGVGTSFDNLDFTLFSNELNANVTSDNIEVPRDGYYNIDLNINPGSTYTTAVTTGGGVAFYALEIWIDGQVYASATQMVFVNDTAGTIPATTLGAACNTFLNSRLTAGAKVEPRLYVTGMTVNYSLTLKLTNTG